MAMRRAMRPVTSARTPKYGMGYRPDPEGHKVSGFHLVRPKSITLTGNADLTSFAPPVMDQGQTGSCTGHATACGVYTSLNKSGTKPPFVPSPLGIYDVARCIDRTDPSQPLTDDGAMPNQVMRGITEWGVRPIQAPTSDGRYSDCDPAHINDEPSLDDLEADAGFEVVGEYQVQSTGAQFLTDIQTALESGWSVCVAADVDQAFEDWDPSQPPIGAPDPSKILGGHEICVLKVYTTNGKRTWEVRNSWGPWGINGDFLATDAWMEDLADARVMAIKEAV